MNHSLVFVGHRNDFSTRNQFVADYFTEQLFIVGEREIKVTYVTFIMLTRIVTLRVRSTLIHHSTYHNHNYITIYRPFRRESTERALSQF